MIGPGLTCTMRPSTSKSASFLRSVSALSWSSSCECATSVADGTFSSPTGGSWNACAPFLPKANVSCHASPLSDERTFVGSTIAGGTNGASLTGASSRSFDAPAVATIASVGAGIRPFAPPAPRPIARRLRRRDATTRLIAPYDTCVTNSTPTGMPASGTSHAPTLPRVPRSASMRPNPMKPPALMSSPGSAGDDCVSSAVVEMRTITSPTAGAQPRGTSGRTNVLVARSPSSSGKRNAA